MKAVRFHAYGGPEVLTLDEVAIPQPGPGQIRIAVKAAGINAIDWKLRSGLMRDFMPLDLPAGLGSDASGVVDAIGEGVTGLALGDAVFGLGQSTMADYAVLDAWAIKPEELSFTEAAGYPVAVETATRILDEVGVEPGQTLLVSGAAGGVGSAVLQLARERGIVTIGTASEPKHGYLRSLGAVPTEYGPGLADRVAALAPNGIHAALDLAGSGIIEELVSITRDAAKVLSIADIHAGTHGVKTSFEPMADPSIALKWAASLFGAGRFTLPVQGTFALDEVGLAHDLSANGHVTGRLVVRVA